MTRIDHDRRDAVALDGLTRRDVLRRSAGIATGAAATAALGRGATAAPARASRRQDAGEVIIYNWYQPWIQEVVPMFEEETGITVTQLGTYSSNDEWWARLNAGENFDVFIPTTDWVQRAMAAELLLPLDLAKIPNYENLFEEFRNVDVYAKEDQTFAVPFARVYYSLTYNTDTFPEAPTSWEVTWDEQYEGKMTLQDQAYARVASTALLLGDDPLNPTKWDEIRTRLMDQKPLVRKYWEDYQNGMELFVNGEVVVGQLTAGRTRMAQDLGAPIAWTVPTEGALTFVDTFAIPKTAENVANGHAFINFLHRPDIMAMEMRGMRYDTVNEAAYGELTEEERQSFAPPEGAKLVLSTDLKPDVRQRMDQLWNEVKLS